ncbi:efflux RND transporter permease subunit [Endozoicomonas sp. SM1973]|uniref:Efflux RND transporter permease subunit n=1 Tax=Spartinivicinus marinus TaxID=2994442 RepID=A0A853I2V0_9GAMM|nr:efflux RND transporter permease subunit [Spartinivicinus marinus]MCX4029690.1 efflux RND transporter permease subunit [Spartinivicinus marinus]NYZ66929.1 efflux RND transporter permease subunit [Spartinivicinus marinus]
MLSNTPYKKGIIGWFAANSVAANLLMLFLIALGIGSAFTIKKQMFPDIKLDTIVVSVDYPGASPSEVAQSVTLRVESAVRAIAGIKKMDARVEQGYTVVILDIEKGFDINEKLDEVRTAVDSITSFPKAVEKPAIRKVTPKNRVIWVALFGDVSYSTLHQISLEVRDEIQALPEVSKANIFGARSAEIAIEITETQLQTYGLTFAAVAEAIRNSSVDIAGGTIKTKNGTIQLRAEGQAQSETEFRDIIIRANQDGSLLRLGDIATVTDGYEDTGIFSRFNQKMSIGLSVEAAGDDEMASSAAVKQYITQKQASLPDTLRIDYWGDTSFYLQGRLNMMLENMGVGALLVFLVLTLFLRIRVAFWVVLGIPISFLGAIWLMPIGPFPVFINIVSLFAFILVLGVVVDDAIIIGESAYSEIVNRGHSHQSVVAGVHRVVVPATFGVLTTMAAFAPILTVGGTAAPFFESIAVVVMLCLFFSLVESKLILPAHLVHMKYVANQRTWLTRLQDWFDSKLQGFIQRYYQPWLTKALAHRYTTIAIFIGMLIITVGVLQGGIVRFIFFPNVPSDFIEVALTMNEGTSNEARNKTLQQIEQALATIDQDYTQINSNQRLVKHMLTYTDDEQEGDVIVELTKSETRQLDANAITEQWREAVGILPGVKQLNFDSSTNAGGGAPVFYQLSSRNETELTNAVNEFKAHLASYEGVFDIESSYSSPQPDQVLSLLPEARAFQLQLADIGGQLRQGVHGEEVQKFQRDTSEVTVVLRYPKADRSHLGDVGNFKARVDGSNSMPLNQAVSWTEQAAPASIRRLNGKNVVTISADIDPGKIEPQTVIKALEETFIPQLKTRYPSLSTELEGASLEEQQTKQKMITAALFALLLIYALIAIPLKSYSQPLLIMAIIPFGLIGAVAGHWLFDLSLSMMSIYGLIALAGVLVNDSLILVDFINQSLKQGETVSEAILKSGKSRFRAIMLTSVTTFLGLVPIILEQSLQAQIVIPMAVALGFGILFATVITLFLIPALYSIFVDIQQLLSKLTQKSNDSLTQKPSIN